MAEQRRTQRRAIGMQSVAENSNGASEMDDRFAGQVGYRNGSRREVGGVPSVTGTAPVPGLPPAPSRSLAELDQLQEPAFTVGDWLDGPSGSLADHPLLRGLLLELPPKGAMPTAAWLDRWFEAARSILELLYVQNSDPMNRR